jgi:hypothetical protein
MRLTNFHQNPNFNYLLMFLCYMYILWWHFNRKIFIWTKILKAENRLTIITVKYFNSFDYKSYIRGMSGKFIYSFIFYCITIHMLYKFCQQKYTYLANTFIKNYWTVTYICILTVITYNIYTSSWSTLTTSTASN